MPDNPHFHDSGRTLEVRLPGDVMAKLATYRREMHPEKTDAEVVAYLVEDGLIGLGLLAPDPAERGRK